MIRATVTLAGKDLMLLWRDRAAMFCVFILPVVVMVLLGLMFGGDAGTRAGFEFSLPAGMVWGLIGSATTFALVTVRERQAGTFLRLRAAPISRTEIILGRGLACWLSSLAELLLLLLLAMAFFGLRPANPGVIAGVFAASAACFAGLMLLLSQLARGEVAVAALAWSVMLVLAMLGGAMMPFAQMPEWIRQVGQFTPVRLMMLVLESAMWRGLPWADIAQPCLMLAAIGLAGFLIGALILRLRGS